MHASTTKFIKIKIRSHKAQFLQPKKKKENKQEKTAEFSKCDTVVTS